MNFSTSIGQNVTFLGCVSWLEAAVAYSKIVFMRVVFIGVASFVLAEFFVLAWRNAVLGNPYYRDRKYLMFSL